MDNVKQIKVETLNKTSLKSAQEKSIKKEIIEAIPAITDIIDIIWPKKAKFLVGKQKPHNVIYFINDEPCFIQPKDAPIIPHIRFLHKYPFLLPTCQVDKGAIPYLISGANVMIPGMTSAGGRLPDEATHSVVAVMCEGKSNALAIGQMIMSPKDMIKTKTGIGIEVLTYIGDNAWNIK